jgi:hypothetical protein
MKSWDIFSRALLIAAVGLAVGHLMAVGQYQRSLLDETAVGRDEPALAEHHAYQALVERRTLAVAGGIILLGAAAAAGRSVAESVALFVAAFGATGLAASLELICLGYTLVPWPLLPFLSGQQAPLVAVVHGAMVIVVAVVYRSAMRRAVKGEQVKKGRRREGSASAPAPRTQRPVRPPVPRPDARQPATSEEDDHEGDQASRRR